MQGIRTGHAQREGLVSEMDPDAVNRDGAGLVADDAVSSKFISFAVLFTEGLYRATKKACFKHFTGIFVRDD